MSRDCKHGQLARSCNVCELERELAEARESISVLLAQVQRWKDEARVAQAKQRIDERQCDDMTAQAAKMASEIAALKAVLKAMRNCGNCGKYVCDNEFQANPDFDNCWDERKAVKG